MLFVAECIGFFVAKDMGISVAICSKENGDKR